MEIKLEAVKLIDGVTTVEYERLEPGFPLFVVAEDGSTKSLAPVGEHTLEDGTIVEVDEAGLLVKVSAEEAPVATEDVVEVSGEEVTEEKVDVAMTEEIKEAIKELIEENMAEKIEEKMKMIFEVIEEVATEVATIKEEMGAMKTKMQKFSKAPAANAIPKITDTPTVFDAFESKAAFLKNAMKK
jgi:predicted house-cleaning noncanonical NTP pyrophosphatase (MazG superfamily)